MRIFLFKGIAHEGILSVFYNVQITCFIIHDQGFRISLHRFGGLCWSFEDVCQFVVGFCCHVCFFSGKRCRFATTFPAILWPVFFPRLYSPICFVLAPSQKRLLIRWVRVPTHTCTHTHTHASVPIFFAKVDSYRYAHCFFIAFIIVSYFVRLL